MRFHSKVGGGGREGPRRWALGGMFVIACAMLAGGGSPALAHHAFAAEYDGDKPFDLTGTVTKVRWVNPHSWLYFDVEGKNGEVTNWSVEFGAPNALAEAGLYRADVATGTQIRIQGFRAKNGLPSGYSVSLILRDGRVIKTGGAPDAAGLPGAPPGNNAGGRH